ncbi:MAG: DMT family transporter [Polyangiaceae bacterium]|nr:DMT family transporter [Polyangiaceae bacterium]
MKIPYGELAALGTALCWTMSSLAFTAAAKRLGSLALNLIRLLIALGLLTLANAARRGLPFPIDATPEAWAWLSASAVVGFVIGDMALFRAFLLIGPRLSMLVMALSPPMTAVLGWIALGEELKALDWLAMGVTLAGVAWVVFERAPAAKEEAPAGEKPIRGYLLALLGAAGQSGGMLLSKLGMKDYDAVAATQIRVIAAVGIYSLLFLALGWWGHVIRGFKHTSGMAFAALGAAAGPFVGVTLSLVAIQHTQMGVAATIMSIVPVMIIPFVILINKERVSARAALGAAVAVAGVALLWI